MLRTRCFLLLVMLLGFFGSVHASENISCPPQEKIHEVVIGAIFRNEAPYFKEWIEYHKLVGVTHFYLYNNGSTDEFQKVLAPYIEAGEVTLIEWPDQAPVGQAAAKWAWVYSTQVGAYEDAINRAKKDAKWIALVDIDEFIVPAKSQTIGDALQRYGNIFPGIEIFWRVYGTSGFDTLPKDKLLIEVLTTHAFSHSSFHQCYKTILKPECYKGFYWPPHGCSYVKHLHPYKMQPSELVINHYMTRCKSYCISHKIQNKKRMDNVQYSQEECEALMRIGNDVQDREKYIQRFVPALRKKMSLDSKETSSKEKKVVYIYPGFWGDIFNVDNPIFNRDGCLEPLIKLREEALKNGYQIQQVTSLNNLPDFAKLIVFEVPVDQLLFLLQYPKERLILFLWEPPSVLPTNYNPAYHDFFSKVFTWKDDLVDGKKYFKFHYPVLRPMISAPSDFAQKKLCALVACNKGSTHPQELYSMRKDLIRYFENEQGHDFSLYGKKWPSSYKNYRGPIVSKIEHLKQYKFCFAYENIKGVPGYITEKIFEAFQAGCIPVYIGASNIEQYIPKNCYIDRTRFENNAQLHAFLKNMQESEYLQYIRNIQTFLTSEPAKRFSIEQFVAIMLHAIEE